MKIEVDDDFTDEIVIKSLANSYVSISENLKDPEMCWHEDDRAAWEELLPALKTVLAWYSTDVEADIKKAKKKKK
jgi:hypothetical protein